MKKSTTLPHKGTCLALLTTTVVETYVPVLLLYGICEHSSKRRAVFNKWNSGFLWNPAFEGTGTHWPSFVQADKQPEVIITTIAGEAAHKNCFWQRNAHVFRATVDATENEDSRPHKGLDTGQPCSNLHPAPKAYDRTGTDPRDGGGKWKGSCPPLTISWRDKAEIRSRPPKAVWY